MISPSQIVAVLGALAGATYEARQLIVTVARLIAGNDLDGAMAEVARQRAELGRRSGEAAHAASHAVGPRSAPDRFDP